MHLLGSSVYPTKVRGLPRAKGKEQPERRIYSGAPSDEKNRKVCLITSDAGLNFKLDVGMLRLDQQVACQRYRQNFLDANKVSKTVDNFVARVQGLRAFDAVAVA